MKRKEWHRYFLNIATLVATRATCPRLSVGAVVVKDNRILGTGYNGSPSGTPHCIDDGCIIHADHCIRSIHAEVNALLSAMQATDIRGATLYCTHRPCWECSKLIVQTGIAAVVYGSDSYKDNRSVYDPLRHIPVTRLIDSIS